MALITCKDCGKEISSDVKKCPNCGHDRRNFFAKHKILSFIGLIVAFGIIGAAINGGKNSNEGVAINNTIPKAAITTTAPTTAPVPTDPPATPEPDVKDIIKFSNVVIKGNDYGMTINGEATNNDSKKHSFTFTVTFYDANKKLVGTAEGALNDIGVGKTKTFSAMSEKYPTAKSYKVEVDTMVE